MRSSEAVVEDDGAVVETTGGIESEVDLRPIGEGSGASPDDRRDHPQYVTVNETGADCLGSQAGATDREVAVGSAFHGPDHFGVEGALQPGPQFGHVVEGG